MTKKSTGVVYIITMIKRMHAQYIISHSIHSNAPHLWQMLAVGMVTQMGAYFFLASGVPGFGSSAKATPQAAAAEQAAAAAAANTMSLLLFFMTSLAFPPCSTPSIDPAAFTTTDMRRWGKDWLVDDPTTVPMNGVVMVMEAIVSWKSCRKLGSVRAV